MGGQVGTKTVTVDEKAKSFKFTRVNDLGFVETIGLNIYPSNNIFEGFL